VTRLALHLSRQWDRADGVEPAMQRWHETVLCLVYTYPELTPASMRQATELECTKMYEQSVTTTTQPWQRY